jgi:hypothetical protein
MGHNDTEPSIYKKGGEDTGQLSDYQLLKKGSATGRWLISVFRGVHPI